MSGFVKKAKKRAGLFVDKLRPGSRQPSPTPPESSPIPSVPPTDDHAYARPQAPQTAGMTAGSVIHELLAAARDGSDLCLPLKAALTAVVKIWDICERTTQANDEYRKLESRLAQFTAVTNAYGKRSHLDPNLKLRLDDIANSFGQLAACVETKLERGITRRALESKTDVAEIKDLFIKISARIESFIFESTVRIEIAVDAILARLPSAEEKELEKELEKWRATTKVIKSAFRGRRVHEAAHNTQPQSAGCMHGTRVGLLCKLVTWIKNDAKTIFWLAGMAGTGKTSVAVTLCRMLDSDPNVLLGGGFFCSRTVNVEARTDVRRIIPTLASLLACQSPQFAVELAAELRPNSGVAGYQPVGDQIGPLLQRPLAALVSETRQIVFVIDALDECSNERELGELLTALAKFMCDANVKFILTSRPETHILGSPISDRAQNEVLQLHIIEPTEVTEDIRLYVDDAFSKQPLAKPWYSTADVVALATLSNGLFIFASTMVSYVLDIKSVAGRISRLQTALAAVTVSAVVIGPLDAMYEFVLTRASNSTKVEPAELEITRHTLACILAVRIPLSVTALAELLDMDTDVLRESLRRLHSVVYVPEADDEIGLRMLHASFGDYLVGRAADNIRIPLSMGDELLTRGCLHVMRTRLHFNVSQSHSSYKPNASTRHDSIVLSLEYACLYWVDHLARLDDLLVVDTDIDDGFRPRFLFWLEVMSVLKQIRRAAAMLIIAAATLQSSSLSTFIRDASSFVASSREAIERSAPHIYLSALPFAAKDSLIYQTFYPLCTGLVSVETTGLDRHGGRVVMTLIGHTGWVNSIAYSANGRLLASGSSDGTVRIWDMHFGEESMSQLRSGDGAVYSVAFAADGRSIASGGESGVVCVWSILSIPATELRLSGHSSTVESVAFSPDSSQLASASRDFTVRIWNPQTGQQIAILREHTAEVNAVTFSFDGGLLASCSNDKTLRLWHSQTREPAREPLRGHDSLVFCVTFSSDGTMLASGSFDGNIRIWNIRAGGGSTALQGHSDSIRSIQFSPDGRSLVSGGDDLTVRVLSLAPDPGESSLVLGRHSDDVRSVTFSPDGLWVASASADHTIRVWDAGSSRAGLPLPRKIAYINSLAVSPDGDLIVSGSQDHSVCVWGTQDGDQKLPPLLGHTDWVTSVTTSSDGQRIASASDDNTIRIWDVSTGDSVFELLHDRVCAVTFSSDARWVASGSSDKTVRIWDIETGQPSTIGSLTCEGSVSSVRFSPDDRLLAAGDSSGLVHLWQTATGQPAREPLTVDSSLNVPIEFSPDGQYILSGPVDNAVHAWDLSTGNQTFVLEGHTRVVESIAYSRNGQFIGTASSDCTVRLWDAKLAVLISILHGHENWVGSVVFTPDSKSIVSGSGDGTIRVWDVEVAISLSNGNQGHAASVTAPTSLEDGWRGGHSGKLLLWVPSDYRHYIHAPHTRILNGERRVIIGTDQGSLHAGESWTACWGGDNS